MNKKIFIFIFFMLSIFVNDAIAINSIEELAELLNNVNVFHANFEQIVSNKHEVMLQQQTGIIKLKKPYFINWTVLSPDKMLIIADGNKIWNYDIDLNQVIIKNFDQSLLNNKIAAILLGKLNFSDFLITKFAHNKLACFKLENNNFQENDIFVSANLCFNNKQQLTKIKLYDQLEQETKFYFSKIKNTVNLKDFRFTIPDNTDVIEDY